MIHHFKVVHRRHLKQCWGTNLGALELRTMRLAPPNAAITGNFTVSRFAHKIGRSPYAKRLTVKLSASLPYVTLPDPPNFKPIIPAMISSMQNTRVKVAGSLNHNIPTIAMPTAPIPVQTAYEVPIGSVFIA